jgi:hypothetical protein
VLPAAHRVRWSEGGWTADDIFSEPKTVYVDHSGALQKAQIDNAEY